MKNAIVCISSCFLMMSLAGCAMNKATVNSYVDPNFSGKTIRKIAVFPIRNARLAPSESQQLNRKVSMAISQKNQTIGIVGPSEAVTLLNDKGLADAWAVFLDNYVSSGIPDANVLADIGDALDVDAILQGEIVDIFRQDGHYGQNKAESRVTVRFTMLDVRRGKMLWEASSEGRKGTITTLEKAPPIIEAITLAVDKVLATLPLL